MTKKHFKAIAQILSTHHATGEHEEQLIGELAVKFSDYFETVNPLFDRDRFMNAVFEGTKV